MTNLKIYSAQMSDVAEIVALLQDDVLGKSRESAELAIYEDGLRCILVAPFNEFMIAKFDEEIVGCFQLTIIPSLSRGASKRAQIESVRVKSTCRGQGIGREMMNWAIHYSREEDCTLVQLTTDKSRQEAHRFYTDLGFEPTHVGMKLKLNRGK